ncbi:UL36 very large tegument protein [Streptomyces sp. NPDC091368]|uniref:UL36 very large tegument protein n=1 Tax=Streptomyces sp. NPDC091368 TaxID=3365993 RepID=UPI0038280C1D
MEIAAFRHWLTELVSRIRPDGGWYGVFAARDPEGLRACFDGTELLPWDVVESLLQDAAEPSGGPFAVRGRRLYASAAGAHDRRAGGAEALAERRDLMERERRHAEARTRELGERVRATPDPAEAARLEHDLAWTRDDHARATARVRELTGRLARVGAGAPRAWDGAGRAGGNAAPEGAGRVAGGAAPEGALRAAGGAAPEGALRVAGNAAPEGAGRTAPEGESAGRAAGVTVPPAAPAKARRRPRGARYAWLDDEGAGAVEEAPAPLPALPAGGAAPRGARFGAAGPVAPATGPVEDPAEAVRAAANAVYALRRLRVQGRSGEAHALLCEALAGPPARLPALAAELHRAGLGADWSTLLWEAASLPPGRLAAVAGVLADAGRAADCEQLLRQGVARPVEELAGACAALRAEDHHREAHALLTAFVRVRPPEDAARLAGADPHGLVPQLLSAARAVSASRERDLLHALRVAGLAGV